MADRATVQLRSDRERFAPWGLFGGKPAAKARSFLNFGTDKEERLPSKFIKQVKRDDVFRGEMAASGGYGNPFERDCAAVLEDVVQEKISIDHAFHEYGVVINLEEMLVDFDATAQQRAAHKASRGRTI